MFPRILGIPGYGLCIAIGLVVSLVIAEYRTEKAGLNKEYVIDIALVVLICGFTGAKLLYVLLNLPDFMMDPLSILGTGGFVVYGGIIAGFIGEYYYFKYKGIPFMPYLNLLIPQMALCQCFGRIGCFCAGCCYGIPTANGVVFPAHSLAPSGIPLLPIQLISAGLDLLLYFYLITMYKKKPDTIFLQYVTLYSIGRFFIEFFRGDNPSIYFGFTISQVISLVMLVLVICYILRYNSLRGSHDNKY